MATIDELRAVKRKYSANLLKMDGVNGVDIDTDRQGEVGIVVYLETPMAEIAGDLPTHLDGHQVRYVYAGPIRKQR